MITVEELQSYTQEYLTEECLSKVPDNVDKREGSIIYDAIAPAMAELAGYYYNLIEVMNSTFIETATGEALDKRVAEQGIFRNPATSTLFEITCLTSDSVPFDVPLDTVFVSLDVSGEDGEQITFNITKRLGVGNYEITSDQVGIIGNSVNELSTVDTVDGLEEIIIDSIIEFGKDEEDDDSLRLRYERILQTKPFGGNIADYVEWFEKQNGIGGVRVFPKEGTPVSSYITFQPIKSDLTAISSADVTALETLLDPEKATASPYIGSGVGVAPIGHRIQVVIPAYQDIEVDVVVSPSSISSNTVEDAVNAYFDKVNSNWSEFQAKSVGNTFRYRSSIIHSQIVASILDIAGVQDATVTLNGSSSNIILESNTSATSKLPRAITTVTYS